MKFSGVFPILVTPFKHDESLDLDSLRRMINLMKKIGVDGVTVLGVLGEANRLSDIERRRVIQTTVDSAGHLPVIVGTSSNGANTASEYSKIAHDLGAKAVMVTPQADPNLSIAKLITYYERITQSMPLPIVLQDHPASSGVKMTVDTIIQILENTEAIKCIKQEDLPTSSKIAALKKHLQPNLTVLTGLGGLYGLFDLKAGSDGFNTGFAFPEILMAIVRAKNKKNWILTNQLYKQFLPLIVFEQQPGVAIRKEIFRLRGAISSSMVRHPSPSISMESQQQLVELLASILPDIDLSKPISNAWLEKSPY